MSDIIVPGGGSRDRRPLSAQVRDRLVAAIREGALDPGTQLPGEHELADQLAVGRSTVREALRLLEQDGLINVRHGRGRFVSALATLRAERPVTEFESVTEMLTGLGYDVRNRVLRLEEARASAAQSHALGLRRQGRVIRLERLRLHGDEPLIYSVNVIERAHVPGNVNDHDWSGSIIELLSGFGLNVVSSVAKITAEPLPSGVASELPLYAESPWLCITETCITDDGRPVLYATDFHRGDVFTFHVVRQRSGARSPRDRKTRR